MALNSPGYFDYIKKEGADWSSEPAAPFPKSVAAEIEEAGSLYTSNRTFLANLWTGFPHDIEGECPFAVTGHGESPLSGPFGAG